MPAINIHLTCCKNVTGGVEAPRSFSVLVKFA